MKKDFFWFDIIVIGILIIIGRVTELELHFLIGVGISILGLHAIILGKATLGNTVYYHSNKIVGRLIGVLELFIGISSFFLDYPL